MLYRQAVKEYGELARTDRQWIACDSSGSAQKSNLALDCEQCNAQFTDAKPVVPYDQVDDTLYRNERTGVQKGGVAKYEEVKQMDLRAMTQGILVKKDKEAVISENLYPQLPRYHFKNSGAIEMILEVWEKMDLTLVRVPRGSVAQDAQPPAPRSRPPPPPPPHSFSLQLAPDLG